MLIVDWQIILFKRVSDVKQCLHFKSNKWEFKFLLYVIAYVMHNDVKTYIEKIKSIENKHDRGINNNLDSVSFIA